MDKILLQGCQFYGYHGFFDEEQTLGQVFTIDCELAVDLTSPSLTDDLTDTISYAEVFEIIKLHAETKRYRLVERLAGAICEQLFNQYALIQQIRLKVLKPNPPIAGHYQAVGIEIVRERSECTQHI